MMLAVKKLLKQTLFTLILIVGASFAVFAQGSDAPPKERVPVVPVKPKETPKPTPTPKKPTAEISGNVQKFTFIA